MASEEPRDVIWMRPEHAATGRPAHRSRAEITAAAVTIADREGLDAVSMRRVATELGTGAASLYRYVDTREDLLDLMIDATGSEYVFVAPTGDWLADLLDISDQARVIMRRHPWLPSLLITRSVLGPNGLALLEHVLEALAPHPASLAAKLEAFGILNATTALFVQNELGGGSAWQQRNAAYLDHALATGRHPQLAELLAPASPAQASPAQSAAEPADRYRDLLARILTGLLGPEIAGILGRAAWWAWPQAGVRSVRSGGRPGYRSPECRFRTRGGPAVAFGRRAPTPVRPQSRGLAGTLNFSSFTRRPAAGSRPWRGTRQATGGSGWAGT